MRPRNLQRRMPRRRRIPATLSPDIIDDCTGPSDGEDGGRDARGHELDYLGRFVVDGDGVFEGSFSAVLVEGGGDEEGDVCEGHGGESVEVVEEDGAVRGVLRGGQDGGESDAAGGAAETWECDVGDAVDGGGGGGVVCFDGDVTVGFDEAGGEV